MRNVYCTRVVKRKLMRVVPRRLMRGSAQKLLINNFAGSILSDGVLSGNKLIINKLAAVRLALARLAFFFNLIIMFAAFSFCFISCASWLMPPLEVLSVATDGGGVTVRFSHDAERNSVMDALTLSEDGGAVSGDFYFDGRSVRFAPRNGIQNGHDYELNIGTGAESVEGRSLMERYVYTFSTKAERGRPLVISVNPHNQAELDEGVKKIDVQFSEAVDALSFSNALSISPSASFRLEWSADEKRADILFDAPLSLSQRYVVTIAKSLCDKNGNGMAEDYVFDFLNGTDFAPPDFTLSYSCNENSYNANTKRTLKRDGTLNGGIPIASSLRLDFTEAVAIDSVSSFISIAPDLAYTVERDRREKRFAEIVFTEKPEWEANYVLTINKGIEDLSGNKTKETRRYLLRFDRSEDMPVRFVQGFFEIGTEKTAGTGAKLFFPIGSDNDYSPISLPPELFPTTPTSGSSGTVETRYYAVFRISDGADSLDYISALKNIEISATNSCASFVIKKIEFLSRTKIAESKVDKLRSLSATLDAGWNLCAAECTVAVQNSSERGFVRFFVGADLKDTNGNSLLEDVQFNYSKQ